jgi:AraC-like DNA-binding protein
MSASSLRFERTEAMIRRDHVDNFLLVLLESGTVHWAGANGHHHVEAGDLFLLDNGKASRSEWSEHRQIYAALPRDLLTAAGWPGAQTSVLLAPDLCTALLRQHLKALWGNAPPGGKGSSYQMALGLASLTAIYFNRQQTQRPASLASSQPSQQSTLLRSIRPWLDANLHRSDLGPSEISATFHLSRSSLYELFRPWGGVRAYLQTRRLERARQILESSETSISISQLAMQLGFRSLSSFSRAFPERWGMSAREARKQAIERSGQPNTGAVIADAAVLPDEQSIDAASLNALKERTQRYYRAVSNLSGSGVPEP